MNYLASMDKPVNQSPPGWAEQLAIGEAELARGETVPASQVHDAIRAALAELEGDTAQSGGTQSGPAARR